MNQRDLVEGGKKKGEEGKKVCLYEDFNQTLGAGGQDKIKAN